MSEETTGKQSDEETRVTQRRAFDAFNEAQAKKRKIRRDYGAAQDVEENKRWVKREDEAGGTGEKAENDAPGG